MELKFDESNLEQVAKIVKHFNPHAHGMHLVDFMKQVARQHLTEPSYVASTGFMLTAYRMRGDYDNLYIKASVAAECFHNVVL